MSRSPSTGRHRRDEVDVDLTGLIAVTVSGQLLLNLISFRYIVVVYDTIYLCLICWLPVHVFVPPLYRFL